MSKYKIESDIKEIEDAGVVFDEWVDIDDDLYHSLPGISSTSIKYLIKECPLKLKAKMESSENESSEKFVLGRAIHKFILENDDFDSHFAIAPVDDKRSREWKIFMNKMKDDPREIIRKSDKEMLDGIFSSLRRPKDENGTNTYDGIIINDNTLREKALFTVDKKRNIILKIKVDVNLLGMFLDLKSTKNAKPSIFMRDAANLGYAIQAAFYLYVARLSGKDAKSFGFIAIEKEKPYLHSVVLMSDEDISLAQTKVERTLDDLSFYINNDIWPGYEGLREDKKSEPLFTVCQLPSWYRYSLEEENGFEGP